MNPLVSQAFAPPPEAGMLSEDIELGVERSTRAIKLDARLRAQASEPPIAVARTPTRRPHAAPEPPAPRRSIAGVVIAILLIAAVAVVVAALVVRGNAAGARRSGVSIRIIANQPVAVTIDGQPAGKTPLTLQRPSSTQPIAIAGPGGVQDIVPDRDQTVDVSPP